MAGLTFSPGTLETALSIAQEPGSVAEATGLAGVGPSSADIFTARDAEFRKLQQTAAESLASVRRPPSPQSIIAFSKSANKFYAGGMTFAPDDVPSALQAATRLSGPTPPAPGNVAGDWEFVSPQAFGQYIQNSDYGFQFGTGSNALNSGLATGGTLQSGAAMKDLERFRQNLQAGYRNEFAGGVANQQALGLGAASAQAGVGQNYTNTVTANNTNAANALSNAALIRGQNNPLSALASTAGGFLSGWG